jgi:hypothetical protein
MSQYMFAVRATAVCIALSALASLPARAAGPECNKAELPSVTGAQRFEGATLIFIAGEAQAQGEANFGVQYAKPASICEVERFEVGDAKLVAEYSPWEKGDSTLLYKFSVSRPGGSSTEVLVVYDGVASLLADGLVFHMAEQKAGEISWYAMFREVPGYAQVKGLVQDVVRGKAQPLFTGVWPAGAKEPKVTVIDTDRLK